jgi:ParB family transcriptional regulator, chromosome partitioning protein
METEILKTKKTDILSIDPRNIYVQDGFNVRVDLGDLDSLSESIASIGQQIPLKVVKDRGFERYRVIDGHRRYSAILMAIDKGAAIPFIKCELFSGNAEDEIFTMIVTGTGQKQLNEVEQAEGLKRLIGFGYKPEELGKKIGKSIPYIYNLLTISNFPKRVKDYIVDGSISGSTVLNIVKVVDDEAELLKHVKRAIDKATDGGSVKKKATAKHVDTTAKKLTDKQKLLEVYNQLVEAGDNDLTVDLLELILFKTKELSVDELKTELRSLYSNK